MDTQKLRAFTTVAETLNYTEAAVRLFTTQATVSKQILALEKAWGVTLFLRAHRQVQLTAAGRRLLPQAQAVVAAATNLAATLNAEQAGQMAPLRLRTIPSIANYRAFNQLAAFHRRYPEVPVQLGELETGALLEALRNGQADIIFTRLLAAPPRDCETYIAERDQFVVVVPTASALAAESVVRVADLATRDLLLLGESTQLLQPVLELFQAAKLTPKVAYQGQRSDLILGMISRGMGISIMMQKAVDLADYPGLTTVPLAPAVHSQLAFMRRVGTHSPASERFWQFVQGQPER